MEQLSLTDLLKCGKYKDQMIRKIKASLSKIGYTISKELGEKICGFLQTLKHQINDIQILASYAYISSTTKSTVGGPQISTPMVQGVIKRIKGISQKNLFINALQKIIQQHHGPDQNILLAQLKTIKSKFMLPNYYYQLFQGLYSFFDLDKQFQLYAFHIMFLIFMQIKYDNTNTPPFDGPIVIFILYQYFFKEILNYQAVITPDKKSQFVQLLFSILQFEIQLPTKQFYQCQAKKILERIFQKYSNISYNKLFTNNNARLFQTVITIQKKIKYSFKENKKAQSQIAFLEIEQVQIKGPKPARTHKQNNNVQITQSPFI